MNPEKLQLFLAAMERSLRKNLTLHLEWSPDEIRPKFVRWVMDSIEFGIKMFWNRREGR